MSGLNHHRPGWKYDQDRRMLQDEAGRFRIFLSGNNIKLYLLEDRAIHKYFVFESLTLACQHAEQVRGDEEEIKRITEKKKKIRMDVEFRHVSASGGFYYWKPAAARKWREKKKWKD